jgi:hypothetical protein
MLENYSHALAKQALAKGAKKTVVAPKPAAGQHGGTQSMHGTHQSGQVMKDAVTGKTVNEDAWKEYLSEFKKVAKTVFTLADLDGGGTLDSQEILMCMKVGRKEGRKLMCQL